MDVLIPFIIKLQIYEFFLILKKNFVYFIKSVYFCIKFRVIVTHFENTEKQYEKNCSDIGFGHAFLRNCLCTGLCCPR